MTKTIRMEEKVHAKGQEIAEELHGIFREKGLFVVNLIGSPGSGKTSLLEALAPAIRGRAAVIEGDLQTDRDKQRIERAGLRAYQINTVGACHLDAEMIRAAVEDFPLDDSLDLLFIENVGNLVCPAGFAIGEDIKVAVVSVTEGDDKPAKYPSAMRAAAALVVTKVDLLPYIDCDLNRMEQDARELNPSMPVFRSSATTGDGIDEFLAWLDEQRKPA